MQLVCGFISAPAACPAHAEAITAAYLCEGGSGAASCPSSSSSPSSSAPAASCTAPRRPRRTAATFFTTSCTSLVAQAWREHEGRGGRVGHGGMGRSQWRRRAPEAGAARCVPHSPHLVHLHLVSCGRHLLLHRPLNQLRSSGRGSRRLRARKQKSNSAAPQACPNAPASSWSARGRGCWAPRRASAPAAWPPRRSRPAPGSPYAAGGSGRVGSGGRPGGTSAGAL